jgi:hypothetical protein
VDEAIMRRVAKRTLRDMGLEEHEAVVVAHKDRSHPHLHFIVNRVHPTQFVLWRKWWDYARLERSLRAQEVDLGLRVVPGWHAAVPSLNRAREGHTDGWQPGAQWIKPAAGPQARRSWVPASPNCGMRLRRMARMGGGATTMRSDRRIGPISATAIRAQ